MPFRKGNKFGGRRGRSSNITRTPTPKVKHDVSDEEMVDEDAEPEEAPEEEGDEEAAATPAQDDDDDDDAGSPPTVTTIPRRRRGRGGGRLSSRAAINTPEPAEEGSESGTPFKRRRGRPPGSGAGRGRGGFRGRRRGAQPEAPRVIDQYGNQLEVVDDEALVDDDPEGNLKVDVKGNLQGGRQYRVRTFTIMGRDERLYMLSTEPARCCGFRDSYLFFTKHPKLYKVLLGDAEKRDLIDRDILPSSYKGRNIGVVTARSVFREFGARIIVGGRRVTDDYKVEEVRMNGEIEGELADPDDKLPAENEEYDRNRYVAWFGASDVYRTGNQAGQSGQSGKQGLMGKRRTNITLQNWQTMHATEASRFNSSLTASRRANLDGIYDTNTNMMFYPSIMQPTHARWEQIPSADPAIASKPKGIPNNLSNGHHNTNGITDLDTSSMDIDDVTPSQPRSSYIFPPIPSIVARNFSIIDTVYESPSISNPGYPGPDGEIEDLSAGTAGLNSISDDIVSALPASCRAAFDAARRAELSWKRRWGTEAQSGLRSDLKIGFSGYPV